MSSAWHYAGFQSLLFQPLNLKLSAGNAIYDASIAKDFEEFDRYLIHAGFLIVSAWDEGFGGDAHLVRILIDVYRRRSIAAIHANAQSLAVGEELGVRQRDWLSATAVS